MPIFFFFASFCISLPSPRLSNYLMDTKICTARFLWIIRPSNTTLSHICTKTPPAPGQHCTHHTRQGNKIYTLYQHQHQGNQGDAICTKLPAWQGQRYRRKIILNIFKFKICLPYTNAHSCLPAPRANVNDGKDMRRRGNRMKPRKVAITVPVSELGF